MNIKAISTALKGKAGAANQFTPALNNITGKYPTKTAKKMTPKPNKPAFKQYGDKGYKPSDGTGVGY